VLGLALVLPYVVNVIINVKHWAKSFRMRRQFEIKGLGSRGKILMDIEEDFLDLIFCSRLGGIAAIKIHP